MKFGHDHEWMPLPGERAFYICACGAVGCRRATIQEVSNMPERDREEHVTARPISDYRTGRVKAHIPDDWDEDSSV